MLDWIGKSKVVNHHLDVPYHVLERKWDFGGDAASGNMVIRGDNLLALKALLPRFAGKVKCIYIDPPYNTGNEGWCYNDNVNDPQIRKWLGAVVGKEGEDFTRHDKWLCMMYPRLKLLQQLLSEDGAIFISIDGNEAKYLRLILDEIFGARCFVEEIIWKNKYGPGAFTKGIGNVHEYIMCYSKAPLTSIAAPLSEDDRKKYKQKDEKYPIRGGYITQPLATKSKDDRPNLVYPVEHNGEEIWPDKQWIWERARLMKAIEDGCVVFNKKDGKWSVRFKQYLKDENGVMRMGKPISILTGPYNQDGTSEMEAIFGDRKAFDNPKPMELLKYLFSFVFNGKDEKDGVYLDSFAGSGTTAHAVLKLNREDGGRRKFILVEMSDYAETITAERVKRVIGGYGSGKSAAEGTGGAFSYYELGEPLMDDGYLNERVGEDRIREYVYYTETGLPTEDRADDKYLMGVAHDCAYYFLYDRGAVTTLSRRTLGRIKTKAASYVVFADKCALGEDELERMRIRFKKIPRDIRRM